MRGRIGKREEGEEGREKGTEMGGDGEGEEGWKGKRKE